LVAVVLWAVAGRLQLIPPLGEPGPVDVAGRSSRHLPQELDYVRHHVARQPPSAVVKHVLVGKLAAVRGDDRPQAAAEYSSGTGSTAVWRMAEWLPPLPSTR
jgi:hypothetical protein